MKILWLTNLRLPIIDKMLGLDTNFFGGGWLTALSSELLKKDGLELIVCYPDYNCSDIIYGEKDNLRYYGFPLNSKDSRLGKIKIDGLRKQFTNILNIENPDIIHIHGTEFQFSYAMASAAKDSNLLEKTVVSIQGLVSVYAKHFYGNLPYNTKIPKTLKEWVISDGINERHKSFIRRGEYEIKTIQTVKHIMGRTSWDKACTYLINPNVEYHFCNETLRNDFYNGFWEYDKCQPHSIFVSQAGTPIKGFHMLIEAIKEVKKYYPDVKVRVAGPNIITGNIIFGNSYGRYIKKMLERDKLGDFFEFMGPLDSKDMKEQLLNTNIFASASSIENSPNSLGEAMLLGVPCISSDVGGVVDMMKPEIEGFCYPADEAYMLAYRIMEMFQAKEEISAVSYQGRKHALITHDPKLNMGRLLEVYCKIGS